MNVRQWLFVACALLGSAANAIAQEQRNYKEGHVTELSFIKVKPGKFEDYMKYLGGPYRALMEENKRAGLVVSWAIYASQARHPNEPDLILAVTLPNMAALDRIEEFDALEAKVMGSLSQQSKATIDRGAMRDVLGSQLMRELVLK